MRSSYQGHALSGRRAPRGLRPFWAVPLFVFFGVAVSAFLSLHGLSSELRFWEATRVDITGNHVLLATEVERAAELGPHVPWLLLEPHSVEQRLQRQPWIARAHVRRTFWRGLVIHVEERQAQATLPWRGALAEFDQDGVLLPLGAGRVPSDLPALTGIDLDTLKAGSRAGDARVAAALEFLARCRGGRRDLWRQISEVALGEPGKVRLLLSSCGAEVWLRPEALGDLRLALLDTVLPDVERHADGVGVVDLRFNGIVVLKPRNPAVIAAKTS